MSIPYESNPTDWANIRVINAWIEYPFANDGDVASKEYKMLCMCKSAEYEAPALTDVMSSAAVAKVIDLPFAADATARFVGDESFSPSDGGMITFLRTFMPVPATRTRGLGSYSHTWPAFRAWEDPGSQTTDIIAFSQENELSVPIIVLRDETTETSPATITYTYTYATSIGSVAKDTIFSPVWGNSGSYYDFAGLKTSNFVVNTGAGGSPGDTTPNITEYKAYINSTYLIVASSIKSYKGNIYVKETIKALAQ
jgi:hypothetical protein